MIDIESWIEHLNNPLVLVGFVLFVVASVVTLLLRQRGAASSNVRLSIGLLFALALIIIAGGLWIAGNQAIEQEPKQVIIQQQTEGNQSPAISSGKGVSIQYASPAQTRPEEKSGNASKPKAATMSSPSDKRNADVIQHTQGSQSPAIQSAGDVNIQFGTSK